MPYTCKRRVSDRNVSAFKQPLGLGRNQGWGLWADTEQEDKEANLTEVSLVPTIRHYKA